MFKTTSQKIFMNRNAKLAAYSFGLLMCTACGGGSSSGSATPQVAVNQAPVVRVSKLSIVAEGQPFELDASGSSDSDGDALTYSWSQISGPAMEIVSPTQAKLGLTAPLLDNDQTASFEVSVSDGAFTRVSTVSLDIETLKVAAVASKATEFGTGGPTNPTVTVGDPSLFEGNKPLVKIIGLTRAENGGYTVHWTADGLGHNMPISSQIFSAEGDPVGTQVDGVFIGGEEAGYGYDEDGNFRFLWGIPFATFQSGDTLYNLTGVLEANPAFTVGYNFHRGAVEGEVFGFGDSFIDPAEDYQKWLGGDITAVGDNELLTVFSELSTLNPEAEDVNIVMKAYVVDPVGQTTVHTLGEFPSHGSISKKSYLAVSSYTDDNVLVAWSQNTETTGYDINMLRADKDGASLGMTEIVNVETDGDQLNPVAVTMTDGNIFVAWMHNAVGAETAEIRGRIVRPNGSFASDEAVLPSILQAFDNETLSGQYFFTLTALNTNEVLVTWTDETSGETEIRALVVDETFEVVSNEFVIATGAQAESYERLHTLVLADNRVIMSWYNDYGYYGDPKVSHTIGFYPVGKE